MIHPVRCLRCTCIDLYVLGIARFPHRYKGRRALSLRLSFRGKILGRPGNRAYIRGGVARGSLPLVLQEQVKANGIAGQRLRR
jgi:hypothetical protein